MNERDEPERDPKTGFFKTVKSYGNMSDQHWSRTRDERNKAEIDYYRERSKAPGVREGGAERNFYCMECDGVIPFEPNTEGARCPHCGADLEGLSKRYFNWVEIDQPVGSDFKALLPLLVLSLTGMVALLFAAWWWLIR